MDNWIAMSRVRFYFLVTPFYYLALLESAFSESACFKSAFLETHHKDDVRLDVKCYVKVWEWMGTGFLSILHERIA